MVYERILLRLAGNLQAEPVSQLDPEALLLVRRLSALPQRQRTHAFNAVKAT